MFDRLKSFKQVLYKGSQIKDTPMWTNRASWISTSTTVLIAISTVAKIFGHDLNVTVNDLASTGLVIGTIGSFASNIIFTITNPLLGFKQKND